MDELHTAALFCDHLSKMIHSFMKILAVLPYLGPDDIDSCLQLSTIDSFEKVVDFNAIINAIVAMIWKALLCCMMFFAECNIVAPVLSFHLTIKV